MKGITYILLAAILWGIGYPFWRQLALQSGPLGLASASFLISTSIAASFDRYSPADLLGEFRKSPRVLIFLGLSAGLLGTGLLFVGLRHLDAGVVSFVEKLQVVFVIIIARFVLGERFPLGRIPLIVLTLMLAFLLSVEDPLAFDRAQWSVLGLTAGLGCSVFYGANVVMYKYLIGKGVGLNHIVFFRMLFGTLFLIPVFLCNSQEVEDFLRFTVQDYLWLCLLCLTTTVIPFKLFMRGVESGSASSAGILELLTPVVAILVSSCFFGERVSMSQLVLIPCYLLCIVALGLPTTAREAERMNRS